MEWITFEILLKRFNLLMANICNVCERMCQIQNFIHGMCNQLDFMLLIVIIYLMGILLNYLV